jgi:hypothetical protein
MARRKPHVGDMAWHKGGLDPRPVAEVSEDSKQVRLQLHAMVTDWVPARNYDFEERD